MVPIVEISRPTSSGPDPYLTIRRCGRVVVIEGRVELRPDRRIGQERRCEILPLICIICYKDKTRYFRRRSPSNAWLRVLCPESIRELPDGVNWRACCHEGKQYTGDVGRFFAATLNLRGRCVRKCLTM